VKPLEVEECSADLDRVHQRLRDEGGRDRPTNFGFQARKTDPSDSDLPKLTILISQLANKALQVLIGCACLCAWATREADRSRDARASATKKHDATLAPSVLPLLLSIVTRTRIMLDRRTFYQFVVTIHQQNIPIPSHLSYSLKHRSMNRSNLILHQCQ